MPYVIRNCPAIISLYERHQCALASNYYCQDCTDCVIKQVIDKLREADNSCNGLNCTECSGFYMCHSQLANKILQLFDIEEIKE